jgi:hypothetical protein
MKPEHEPKSDFTFLKKGPGTGFFFLGVELESELRFF